MTENGTTRLKRLDKIKLAGDPLPNDIEELESLFVEEGYDTTAPNITNQLETRYKKIDEEHDSHNMKQRPEEYIEKRNRALSNRDYGSLRINNLFMVYAPAISLATLIFTELLSIFFGFRFYVQEESALFSILVASTLSTTVIIIYLVLEWSLAQYVFKKGKPLKYKFSFLIWKEELRYLFGIDMDNSKLEEITEADDYRAMLRARSILVLIIIIHGVLGRIGGKLSEIEGGNAIQQFQTILQSSTIIDWFSYIGIAFVTLGLLEGTRYMLTSQFGVYINAVGEDEINFFDSSLVDQKKEAVKVQFYKNRLQKIWLNREDEIRNSLTEEAEPIEISTDQNTSDQTVEAEQKSSLLELVEKTRSQTSKN